MNALARLVYRISTDTKFRQELAKDMETALRRAGITLSSEEQRVLRRLVDTLVSSQQASLYEPTPDLPTWVGYRDIHVVEGA